ncbi:hypothetical protein [Amycolatopsis cihanbeyliensis]|uniref:Putative secreted protein with PEP-CTERM sorting signal n=1 Tax=Amycolatopsis cihanbeyliensis TaxID=1128664 RepID=A0A542DDF2_AMYCI|nr:hypothetical protein [Amycolatopsis cihanbeyliensis]TQJ01098.1 putative secreted protein with PEP-CTERM sorting signal [Amycolatopsis cihanbeyliensis]
MLGILLIVQGVGGFINRVAQSGSTSWFVQLHLLPSTLHIPASVVMALLGIALVVSSSRRKSGAGNG